ncbi:MAG: biotin transporter BioY [Lachnospiraceae bacterium]|nr:biotin transporter BioY [Lachnospiraceae bacterium]
METVTSIEKSGRKSRTYAIAATAVMTAALCIIAPFSVPVGPVPISLATLVIYLAVYVLGWKMGTVSVLLYLLLGMVGIPVFSGFSGGFVKLAGPTGGYLVGYIPLALISGLFILLSTKLPSTDKRAANAILPRLIQVAGMVLGTAVLYALGTAWFCIIMDCTASYAMGLCVLPFIPGDFIKILIAILIGPELKKRIINQ